MVYAKPYIFPGESLTQTPLGCWHPNGSLNLSQKTRPSNNQQKKKKRTCKIVDFVVPAEHRVKWKKEKYLDLARELKKLWNIKVTFIPIIIGTFGTVTKRLIKGLRGLGNKKTSGDHLNYCIIEIGQNTEYWKESWRLEETCCHSDSSERPSANTDGEKSQGVIFYIKI